MRNDILILVKASNTVHATSKEMKTDGLTTKFPLAKVPVKKN